MQTSYILKMKYVLHSSPDNHDTENDQQQSWQQNVEETVEDAEDKADKLLATAAAVAAPTIAAGGTVFATAARSRKSKNSNSSKIY